MAAGHNERSSPRPPQVPPPPVPSTAPNNAYPPTPSPPRSTEPTYGHNMPVPAETDPLALGTSPQQGGDGFAAHDFAGQSRGHQSAYGGVQDQDDEGYFGNEPYTAIPLGEPASFTSPHGQAGSLDMSEDGGDLSRSIPRTSLSTHNSRTQLRAAAAGGAYLPTGAEGDPEKHVDSRPVHAGPSITMAPLPSMPEERQSRRAERQYGSGEKGGTGSAPGSGYNTPRSRSQERSRGGGLGNWAGPGQGNSPYGRLGDSNQASGYTSAASSNPNLQFAEGDFIPSNGNWFSRAFFAVLNSHYIVRWMCVHPLACRREREDEVDDTLCPLSLFLRAASTSSRSSPSFGSPPSSSSPPSPTARSGLSRSSGGPSGSRSCGSVGGALR